MKPDMLQHLACTRCGGRPLAAAETKSSASGEMLDGFLRCSGCGTLFRVRGGIPRFVLEDPYAASFGLQWQIHRRTQLDSYTGLPVSRNRLFGVSGWPESMRGELVLEAGCGAGRFTEVLADTGATVLSFDLSDAVEANFENNGSRPNVHIVQANIYDIPAPRSAFDRVLCLGVVQHTPDPHRAFTSLVEHLKPGGEIVFDVYSNRLRTLLQFKYLLRPLARRLDRRRLYDLVSRWVPRLAAPTARLKRRLGRLGARLSPILEYSELGLPEELNTEWSILDTFDMYAPAYDRPQSVRTVRRWFEEQGFRDFRVGYGPNGVVAKGRRPGSPSDSKSA